MDINEYIRNTYRLIRYLGDKKNIMLVESVIDNKNYVVKIVKAYDRSVYDQLKNHPVKNTPHIFEIMEDEQALYVVEEYIEGKTLDVFFDVDSLRSGDDWELALHEEIKRRDVLFLCWSHFARESKWVDAEWRYALEQKGADCIEPVPIESPDICPPPAELSFKHFNDKLLYIIDSVR